MNEYFTKPKFSGRRVNAELDLSTYTTKEVLKNTTGVDISKFAKMVDLKS